MDVCFAVAAVRCYFFFNFCFERLFTLSPLLLSFPGFIAFISRALNPQDMGI